MLIRNELLNRLINILYRTFKKGVFKYKNKFIRGAP